VREISVWVLPSGRLLARFSPEGIDLGSGDLSTDGRCLALSRRQGGVLLYEVTTGKVRQTLPGTWVFGFSPDGKRLVSRDERPFRVYDLETGGELRTVDPGGFHFHTATGDLRLLATGGAEGTGLLWDLSVPVRKKRAVTLSERELAEAWKALAEDDAPRADRGLRKLLASPDQAVALLKTHLRPAAGKPWERIGRLLADLDDDAFDVREAASKELAAIGAAAWPALVALRGETKSVEVRRRVQDLLGDPPSLRLSGEALRQARAVEALERIGSAEARRLLEALARGDERAPLTLDARAALGRLGRR
jgi:hypothetical protein